MIPDISALTQATVAPLSTTVGLQQPLPAPDPMLVSHFNALMNAASTGATQSMGQMSGPIFEPGISFEAPAGAAPNAGHNGVDSSGRPIAPEYGSVGVPVSHLDDRMNLGESILAGMQSMSDSYNLRMQDVQKRLADSTHNMFSIKETLQLQYDLTQITIQQDMAAKIADKTSQGLQTLFKNQ